MRCAAKDYDAHACHLAQCKDSAAIASHQKRLQADKVRSEEQAARLQRQADVQSKAAWSFLGGHASETYLLTVSWNSSCSRAKPPLLPGQPVSKRLLHFRLSLRRRRARIPRWSCRRSQSFLGRISPKICSGAAARHALLLKEILN